MADGIREGCKSAELLPLCLGQSEPWERYPSLITQTFRFTYYALAVQGVGNGPHVSGAWRAQMK